MNILTTLIQILVPLVILNVWLLRAGKATPYRGGNARNLKEEFQTYGLPEVVFYSVGVLKVGAAIAILAGFFLPALTTAGAALLAVLMAGAVAMHLKVKDEARKFLPATIMLLLSLWLVFA